jgi:prepilin-type processing-associated H-X9-DG protein/prepilin-type N-terminal cleavage/methylation domain-containing protein
LAVERKGEMKYGLDMPNQSRHGRSAFTLVELLTVIAIIGILAVLLLAAITGAKARALQIQCANNVRQLGIGLQAFVTDNGAYPLYSNPDYYRGAYPEYKVMWITALQYTELSVPGNSTNHIPFSKWSGQGVWKCPAANKPSSWPQHKGYVSYGYNTYGMSAQTDTNSLGLGGHYVWDFPKNTRYTAPPVRESEVVVPSEMMAIGDGFEGGNSVIRDGVLVLWRTHDLQDYLGSAKRSYTRHQGRANVVFCDGHVESPKLQFLFADTSDAALVRWNRDHQPHREKLSP